MLREMFSTKLEDAGVRWLEPAWKSIISNKALLPMLWKCSRTTRTCCRHTLRKMIIRKWKICREAYLLPRGANVSIIENGKTLEAVEGPYGEEGMIVQHFISCRNLATAIR